MRENQKVMQVFKDHNVSPLSAFWGLAQIPVFVSCFFGIKKMAELPVPGFSTGGVAWISDLTLADPYCILPVLSSVSMLLSFEVYFLSPSYFAYRVSRQTKRRRQTYLQE